MRVSSLPQAVSESYHPCSIVTFAHQVYRSLSVLLFVFSLQALKECHFSQHLLSGVTFLLAPTVACMSSQIPSLVTSLPPARLARNHASRSCWLLREWWCEVRLELPSSILFNSWRRMTSKIIISTQVGSMVLSRQSQLQ